MSYFGLAFFLFALAGLLCCTGYLVLIVVSAIRFRRCKPLAAARKFPPVTLLKPLCGLEPRLEENLASFFAQDYPQFEVVFGTRGPEDPALAVARAVQARYPHVPVQYVFSGEPDRANAKVCSLEKMIAAASFDYLVISDSDVHVTSSYIEQVTQPLLDPKIGLVNCVYRGVPTGGIWSRLEALGMSVEMTAGVIVDAMLEGMKFALGPTMAIRRDVLGEIGGIGVLADYCADDFVLGQKVAEAGYTVVLSSYVIEHVVLNRSLKDSILHQVRWMKSTRFSRPKGHVGSVLTFAMPFGLLGLLGGWVSGQWLLAAGLFGAAVLNRLIMCVVVGWGVVRDRFSLRDCWLYPLRDFMGFCFWLASFSGSTIVWRQRRFLLGPGGIMVSLDAESKPAAVTVDSLS